MSSITMKSLLEAGVHYGHRTHRWNPKMKPYIFGAKNGVHIINLQKTMQGLHKALTFVESLAAQGGSLLFVATKRQAKEVVRAAAESCDQPYVVNRWLGGSLTNFPTIKARVDRMKKLEAQLEDSEVMGKYTKKEGLELQREFERLKNNLWGIRDMKRQPKALFILDPRKEKIAIAEANRLNIPTIAVTDTNCDPAGVDFLIPSNDDSLRAITLFAEAFAQAIRNGRAAHKTRQAKDAAKAKEDKFVAEKVDAEAAEAAEAKEKAPKKKAPAKKKAAKKTTKKETAE